MIRDELRRALETLGDRLPGGDVVVLVRRAFDDRRVSFIRGDVEAVTGHPAPVYERPASEWVEIVHPADRETVLDRLAELPGRDRLSLEYRLRRADGGTRWIREELRVLRSGPQAPPEIVGLLTDVTARRSARSRVSRLEAELWRARKMEAVGKVAAEVAHDFNNLLTAILGSCDLLRHEDGLDDDTVEEMRVIRESATRGRELVRRILSFAARSSESASGLDAAAAVRDLKEIISRLVGADIELELRLPEGLWPVAAKRAHLEQVVLNLVANAGDAMPGGGTLTVSLENRTLDEPVPARDGPVGPGRYLCLQVRDTGTGMTPAVRDRLFEPFFTTKAESGGSGGFGLSTVLRIVRGYGGGVEVDSELGVGTTFRVYLPVAEVQASPSDEIKALEAARDDQGGGGGLRILVLEDDPVAREMVDEVLTGEGHTVVPVGTASEALRVFDRMRPTFDLLISDVVLPERSGPAVHGALVRRVGELPVIFMSAYGRDTAVREGMVEADAVFLDKPVEPAELVRVVDEIEVALRARKRDENPGLPGAGAAGG